MRLLQRLGQQAFGFGPVLVQFTAFEQGQRCSSRVSFVQQDGPHTFQQRSVLAMSLYPTAQVVEQGGNSPQDTEGEAPPAHDKALQRPFQAEAQATGGTVNARLYKGRAREEEQADNRAEHADTESFIQCLAALAGKVTFLPTCFLPGVLAGICLRPLLPTSVRRRGGRGLTWRGRGRRRIGPFAWRRRLPWWGRLLEL